MVTSATPPNTRGNAPGPPMMTQNLRALTLGPSSAHDYRTAHPIPDPQRSEPPPAPIGIVTPCVGKQLIYSCSRRRRIALNNMDSASALATTMPLARHHNWRAIRIVSIPVTANDPAYP